MRLLLRILLALLVLLPVASSAQEQEWEIIDGQAVFREKIRSFLSEVHVQKDGTLDVTETIRIRSWGQEINHGIQRDFPTTYTNKFGQKTRTGFELVSVTLDGKDEPWERMSLGNGVRIRIGRAEVTLPPKLYTYVIRYRTTRQISYGRDSDDIYWNATGNGWTFPIDVAEARITLPSEAKFGNRAVYTGAQGSTEANAEVIEERPGYIAFRTTRPLEREQGLTVAAAIPKGVIDAPSEGTKLGWWLADWGPLGAAVAALLGLIAFYIRAWAKAGRNPRAGTIVPAFTPPDDLSPAAMRYISRMKFDNRAFSAAIVDLGVRGKLRIDQAEGGWLSKGTTTLIKQPADLGDLPHPERNMLNGLFASSNSIELKQAYHARLQNARGYLEAGLENIYRDRMFSNNRSWAVTGLLAIPLAMFAVAAVSVLVSGEGVTALYVMIALAVLMCGGAWWIYDRARQRKNTDSIFLWAGIAILGGLGGFFALGTFGFALSLGAFAVLLPLLMIPVAISAFWWMYAPTPEGRATMDRIAGFKQYLGIAEEERLDTLHPPEKTPELFERYLPHAIALEVENRWAERFAGVLAAAAASGAAVQSVGWYSGSSNFWTDPDRFTSSVGSSLASTVSSAATSPSSSGSSGSSGGGSSGGGGGGGGGSGW